MAAFHNHLVYRALIDTFPPDFQDGITSKFALHTIALSPTTPLQLQADYVTSLAVGCAAMLCFSGALFCADKAIPGWFTLGGSLLIAFSTIQSWKTYRQNYDRKAEPNDEEES